MRQLAWSALGAGLDFAQAFAQKRALWIGNTGFGYGDDATPTLSEELLSTFARNLGSDDSVTVGDAMRMAKQDYALYNMGAYGPYDLKVIAESTLYGLPTYRVSVPDPQNGNDEPQPNPDPIVIGGPDNLTRRTYVLNPELQLVSRPQGDYYVTKEGPQAMLYNPIQPRMGLDITLPDDDTNKPVAHGALLLGGRYEDRTDFNPVITMPVTETERYEPEIIYNGWQPPEMARINHFRTEAGLRERLTVTPGQFLYTRTDESNPDNVHVIGIERLYKEMTYEVYYSTSSDYSAPIVASITTETLPPPTRSRCGIELANPAERKSAIYRSGA